MPDIDRTVDIQVGRSDAESVTVLIPLTGDTPTWWLERFQRMAAATELPGRVDVQDKPDRLWVQVTVLTHITRAEIMQLMDAVAVLISEVNAAEQEQSSAVAEIEAAIRDWSARGQQ